MKTLPLIFTAAAATATLPGVGCGAFEGLTFSAVDNLNETVVSEFNEYRNWAHFEQTLRYNLPELNKSAVEVGLHIKPLTFQFKVQSSGDEIYRESRASFGAINDFGAFNIMLSAELFQLSIAGYGSRFLPGLSAAGKWNPSESARISGGFDGLVLDAGRPSGLEIPRIVWGRFDWMIYRNSRAALIWEYSEWGWSSIAVGYSQGLSSKLAVNALVADHSEIAGGGVHFRYGGWIVGVGLINNAELGWSQRFTIRCQW